jgi:hypothetical protein
MCFVCFFLKISERQQFGSIQKQLGKTEKNVEKNNNLFIVIFKNCLFIQNLGYNFIIV